MIEDSALNPLVKEFIYLHQCDAESVLNKRIFYIYTNSKGVTTAVISRNLKTNNMFKYEIKKSS